MLKMVDITFHANTEYGDAESLIKAQYTSLIYLDYCRNRADITVIKHYSGRGIHLKNFDRFLFFKGNNRFGFFSFRTMRYLQSLEPDLVLVRGLIFPVQVLAVRLWLGKKVKIIARHHADIPFKGLKKVLQQWADTCINAYLFTSKGIAETWFRQKIIRDPQKIIELPATLTVFSKKDKKTSKQLLSLSGESMYLWVGRLNPNKDPLTVLKAFDLFLLIHPEAGLHMVFQSDELISSVKKMIQDSERLRSSVLLHGVQPYEKMCFWFSAADFFISASYSEGGSSAILEAMACGCIPIVSRIPASMQVIDKSDALHFAPGNTNELLECLLDSAIMDLEAASVSILDHYTAHFSAQAVTDQLMDACVLISGK
jgi:glycosyltransferase involved in cell wall biosynthesis